ncbi:hypothetical protein H2203_009106 [Taxawa tesnikishii (nom. ined.)]|nr:hypothetical protein H2203_009106 [Dothideales sp. JES 119]
MDDRTKYVPAHDGPYVLPRSPFFSRLLRFAHNRPPRLAVRDDIAHAEATYLQLLTDVLALRNRLRHDLRTSTQKILAGGEPVYIAILAAGGYEYAVAMLAVLAFGGACVPMTVALPPKEALYYARKSRSIAVLASSSAMSQGVELEKLIKAGIPRARSVVCQSRLPPSPRYLDENAPGVVIFTSGTTGPPKGSVMPRAFVHDFALSVADHYHISESDVLLHLLPVHHATGVGMMFFPLLVAGACIEFRSGSFDPGWTWERWRREHTLEGGKDTAEYVAAARQFRASWCGTSALPKPIADFWQGVMGKKILLRYGATEFGAVFKVRMDDDHVPEGSVGEVPAGIDIKLSEGDEGEVLIRSPYMFSKLYMYDDEATRKAHDEEGYYRSGDIARREGNYYWILGRASVDIIKSGGYKISALDIEREILGLPYISEVTVVGVPDEEFGQRVAAAVVLRSNVLPPTHDGRDHRLQPVTSSLDIEKLREDLSDRLARYKMPTLLTILEGEIPKTATGKVSKKLLGPQLFPPDHGSLGTVQKWHPAGGRKSRARL